MEELKEIRTYTLCDYMIGCYSYEEVVDYLSNVLVNERNHRHYYTEKKFRFVGRTLVLFKYKAKLVGKAIFKGWVDESRYFGLKHCLGYFIIEPDSIEVFSKEIDVKMLNEYFPHITNLGPDRRFDLESVDKINKMIEDYS